MWHTWINHVFRYFLYNNNFSDFLLIFICSLSKTLTFWQYLWKFPANFFCESSPAIFRNRFWKIPGWFKFQMYLVKNVSRVGIITNYFMEHLDFQKKYFVNTEQYSSLTCQKSYLHYEISNWSLCVQVSKA